MSKQSMNQWLLTGACAFATALPAYAQDAADQSGEALEEVIVTAQNRKEDVNDVPIAISVISGEALQDAGFSNLNDVDKIAPVVQLNQDQGTVKITVRGVGTNSNDESQDTSVVVNVDGEYINRPNIMSMALFDIDRVEVLRGPQGTLYGRNSTAGAINFITRQPGQEFGVDASASFGNYSAMRFDGGVDVPLSEVAAFRFSGFYEDRDGYVKHPGGGGFFIFPAFGASESDSNRSSGVRASMRFNLSEALTLNFALEHANRDIRPSSFAAVDLNRPGNAPTGPGCNAPGYESVAPAWPQLLCIPSTTNFLSTIDRSNFAAPLFGPSDRVRSDTDVARARVQYEFSEAATLSYIGGYREFSGHPGDRLTLPTVYQSFSWKDEADTQSHELRLNGTVNGIIYQVGGFYFKEKLERESGFFVAPIGLPGGTYLSYFGRDIESDSKSLFGQVEFPVNEQFTVVGGLRYTENSRDALYINGSPFAKFLADGVTFDPTGPNFTLLGAGPGRKNLNGINAQKLNLASDENKMTWLAGVNYKPNSDTLIYGKVSTGFKGGGFDAIGDYKPESNTAVEAGWKQTFGSAGQYQLNLGAFHYDYKDLQVSVLLDTTKGGQTFNAGKATIWGVEADGVFKFTDHDIVRVSANYLNAKYDELLAQFNVYCVVPTGQPAAACNNPYLDPNGAGINGIGDLDPTTPGVQQPNFAGNRPAFSPELVLSAGYEHIFELGGAGTLTAGVNSVYKSEYFTDFYNYSDGRQKAFVQSDVSLEYAPSSKRFKIQAFARNLEDERPLTYGSFVSAGPDDIFNWQFGAPRTYGVRVSTEF